MEASYNPIYDVKGNLSRIVKFASDVTDRVERSHLAQETASKTSIETGESAVHGSEIASKSKALMGDLTENIERASKTLEQLNRQADQIKNIVETISGIAGQTNLLAINAAIEAARAGEHGSGFAVVADEVRQLAMRTATSTSEIESVVDNNLKLVGEATEAMDVSLTGVQSGVELVDEVGAVVDQISGAITTVVDSIHTLSQEDQR